MADNHGGIDVSAKSLVEAVLNSKGSSGANGAKAIEQGVKNIDSALTGVGETIDKVNTKTSKFSKTIESVFKGLNSTKGDKRGYMSSFFGDDKSLKKVLGYFITLENKQESLNKLMVLGKANNNSDNMLKYLKNEEDTLRGLSEAWRLYKSAKNDDDKKNARNKIYKYANAYEAMQSDKKLVEQKYKDNDLFGRGFTTNLKKIRNEVVGEGNHKVFSIENFKNVFNVINDVNAYINDTNEVLQKQKNDIETLAKQSDIVKKSGSLDIKKQYFDKIENYLLSGGSLTDFSENFIKNLQNQQTQYNNRVSDDLKIDVFATNQEQYLLDLAATTEMVADKKENADEQIQESAKETADVVEKAAEKEVKAQNELGESVDKSAKKQKKAKEETKKASKDAADAAQKEAKERVEAEEQATAAVVEGVEKQKQSTEEQIKSQKELAEAYRDTLKNKSISSLENNIAQNEYKIKKGDKNKEELEWQLPILKEVLSLKQKEAEKQKYIEQETKRVRKEMDKHEKGRLANIERETQALEQQREEVERQRKESERLENISKEQLRIRNEQDDDAKYLSQRGIVGDEDGWSVVKELGFARTQQVNYGYNKDTGLLDENPAAVITNYEKLKNAIIATDKAVQTLEHDLKVIQTKHPGIDTSYLEKNLSAAKNHLAELNKERNLYAQSDDYMETYIKHNKEIAAVHDKTKNSLAQKDVVSKYAEQLRAEKDAQKLLIDTNNKLLFLEEERFRIQNSLNLGKSKNEIKDKERILEIEKETNDLLVRRYNLRVQYNTYDNKAAAKIAQRKTNNDIQLDYNKQQKEQNDNTAELSKQLSVIEKYNKEQSKLNVLKAKDAKFNRSSFNKNEITEQEAFVKQLSSDAYQAIMVIKQLRTEGKITKDEFKNALKQFTNAKLGTLSIAQVKDINANSDLAKAKYTEKAAANELEKIYKKLYSLEEARFIIQNKLNLNKSKNEIKDSENLISINKRINELLERRDKLAKYHNVRDDDKAKDFEYKQLVNDIQLDENKDAFNQGKITKIYKEQLEIIEQYNKEQSKLNVLKEQANKINGKTVYDARIKEQEDAVAKARQSAQDALDIIEKQRKVSQISIGQWDNAKNAFYDAEKGTLTASQVSDMQETQKRIQAAKTEKQALESLDSTIKNVQTSFVNLSKVSSVRSNEYSLTNALDTVQSAIKRFNLEKQAAIKSGINQVDINKKETDLLASLGISVNDSTVGAISKLSDKISYSMQEIFESGKLSSSASNDFIKLHSSLQQFVNTKDLSSFNGIQDFLKDLSKFSNELDGNLDRIRKQNEITWITDMASGFDKFTNKSDEFVNTLSTLKSKISAYNQALAGKDANLIGQLEGTLLKDAPKLINKLNNMLSGKGTLFEDSEGQVHALSDLNTWILKYANSQKLVLEYGSKLKTENNAVTGTFKDQNGQVIKLTATMDELSHSMKVVSSAQKPIKTLGVAFKDVVKEGLGAVQAHIDVNDVINKVISSAQKGIETLKQYDSALTNISYTMNMTKDNLSDLGESAVDMAQDLGLSLDNTLKIYQIYANMQTTAEEIAETARPTAILSNLSGVDASTASDQIQGILNQFNMLKDADADAAETSMHVVDVLDKISANVAIDYAKGIGIITDAVTATGSAAADAGMSYEQLAAVSAKVAERTREDGSSIGNAIKTILTRISKVGKMPGYADEVDNETLSKASESLNEIGIAVYNADGSFRNISVILGELAEKWDGLTDAQQSNISYNVAATRQSNKFRAILEAWTSATELATDATNTLGNAEANQEKYLESYNGKIQQIKTNMDAFWLSLFNSEVTSKILDFLINITELLNTLSDTIGSGNTALLAGGVLTGLMTGMKYLKDNGLKDTIKNFGRAKMFALYKYAEINRCSLGY